MKKILARIFFAVAVWTLPLASRAATVNWDFGLSFGSGNRRGGGAGGMGTPFSLRNDFGLPEGSILGILSNILGWLLSVFAIAGIVGFVISGIMYLVSAGDDDLIEKGKTGMKYSIIGIIVGLSGFLIMQAVEMMLSGSSSTF